MVNPKQLLSPVFCGVDPGLTTGYGLVQYDTAAQAFTLLESGEVHGLDGARTLADMPVNFWVIEDFKLRRTKAHEVATNDPYLQTVRFIGYMEALLADGSYAMQLATKKAGCPDTELRKLDLYTKDSKHARDAIRHVVVWVRLNLLPAVINTGPPI